MSKAGIHDRRHKLYFKRLKRIAFVRCMIGSYEGNARDLSYSKSLWYRLPSGRIV